MVSQQGEGLVQVLADGAHGSQARKRAAHQTPVRCAAGRTGRAGHPPVLEERAQ